MLVFTFIQFPLLYLELVLTGHKRNIKTLENKVTFRSLIYTKFILNETEVNDLGSIESKYIV